MTGMFALLVFLTSVGLLVTLVVAVRSGNLQTVYHHLARQYGGVVEPHGWFGLPVVRFTHRDMAATVGAVRPFGPWSPRATQIVVCEASRPESPEARRHRAGQGAVLPFTCEITPAGILQRVAYLVGRRRPLTDSPEFELTYQVETDHREQTQRLLTRYVQVAIDRLRYFQGGNDVYVLFQKGELTVRRRGVLRTDRALRQYVALALELYDQAIASYAVGVDFVEAALHADGEAVCKVCGDPLDREEVVYCRVCNTPHHRDCWRYFGGCSIYACGERRFNRAPRLAREKA